MRTVLFALIAVSAIALLGVGLLQQQTGGVTFDASAFALPRENPYFPLRPGTTYFYESQTEDGLETGMVVVTSEKKKILGVNTTVIRDSVFLDGELTEDTFDWFAADHLGNVWYFGEDSREIEDGKIVSHDGSWQAGVNNALPGVIMEAHPMPGDHYAEENAPGIAEDEAQVLTTSAVITIPGTLRQSLRSFGVSSFSGSFTLLLQVIAPPKQLHNCLKTQNLNPFEPDVTEWKYYAPGIGLIKEVERDEKGVVTKNRLIQVSGPNS